MGCTYISNAILKTLGEAERCISDKARIVSVLNDFLTDSFYTYLVYLFIEEFSMYLLYKPRKSR